MRNNKIKKYKEYSTGESFSDSIAFEYKELEKNNVINFHKQWKSHRSKEMIQMYTYIHHYLSKKEIPKLDISCEYEGQICKWVQLYILDLDPQNISIASNMKDKKQYYITQPRYIEWNGLFLSLYDCEKIFDHLQNYLYTEGIYVDAWDSDNFRITGVKDNYIQIMVTDLAGILSDFCVFNLERINKNIPNRSDKPINTINELFVSLSQEEVL